MKFNFPKKPYPISEEQKLQWEDYKKSVLSIEKYYSVKSSNNPNLSSFHLFKTKESARVLNSWQVYEEQQYFKLILLKYKSFIDSAGPTGGGRRYYDDGYLYGLITTNLSYGHVLIRPEKILDKVTEFFNPIEIDFQNHKKFSNQFFVLSDNKEFLIRNFSSNLLEYLSKFKKLELEIINNQCLFRLEKSINKKETHLLCELGIGLSKLL